MKYILILLLSSCYVAPEGPPSCNWFPDGSRECGFGGNMIYKYEKDE